MGAHEGLKVFEERSLKREAEGKWHKGRGSRGAKGSLKREAEGNGIRVGAHEGLKVFEERGRGEWHKGRGSRGAKGL